MLGPGQMVTALCFLTKTCSYLMAAELLKPTQRHSLLKTSADCVRNSSSDKSSDFSCSIFSFWYFFEAVQMGALVNSVLEIRNFSVQGLPGDPFSILSNFSVSPLAPFR